MIGIKSGKVTEILKKEETITEVLVKIKDAHYKAINYNRLTGPVQIGDRLLLNTTAVDLSLGTGGFHFVISNLDRQDRNLTGGGHIMKLRYTPYQLKVFAAEEQKSPYHDAFNRFQSLDQMPVIVGTLHSMLAPIVEVLKFYNPELKITYIMTDGAALPIDLSNMVRKLKNRNLINYTITIGNAFGGDFDCVNIYNGLIAAKEIARSDITVVTMGPGIVGTGTQFGFTGIEQGNIIDAVNDLEGIPIAVPRISFSDSRERHKGISHHTITVLDKICKTRAKVSIPNLDKTKNEHIAHQLKSSSILQKHDITYMDIDSALHILENSPIEKRTMGRDFQTEFEYFATAGIAAQLAIQTLNNLL